MILTRLTFYSRIHSDDALSDVRNIVTISRRRNTRDGLTAALIFDGMWFAQELEGSESTVSATFERILRDWRHGDVSLVALQPVQARRYPNVPMTAAGRRADNDDLFRHYCDGAQFDPREMRADRLADLVEAVTAPAIRAASAA